MISDRSATYGPGTNNPTPVRRKTVRRAPAWSGHGVYYVRKGKR